MSTADYNANLVEGHQLPSESISALRQLLLNAVDAIDNDLVLDVLDAGMVCYAVKALVVASCSDDDDFDMIETQFDESLLLNVEVDSARALMTKLFGARWSPRSTSLSDLNDVMVDDGRPFIRRVKNRVKS